MTGLVILRHRAPEYLLCTSRPSHRSPPRTCMLQNQGTGRTPGAGSERQLDRAGSWSSWILPTAAWTWLSPPYDRTSTPSAGWSVSRAIVMRIPEILMSRTALQSRPAASFLPKILVSFVQSDPPTSPVRSVWQDLWPDRFRQRHRTLTPRPRQAETVRASSPWRNAGAALLCASRRRSEMDPRSGTA